MPCLVPFNNRNLDTCFFAFKPVGVFVEDLVEALKYFSFCSEDHGCAYSSVFKSIHGNLIVWYGAWMKRSSEKRKLLNATLISTLSNISSMAILIDYDFFDAYAGESKDGNSAAKFSSGDTISVNLMLPNSEDLGDLSYACLSMLKSCFLKMEGVTSGVCFRSYDKPRVASLHVWKSLHSCYSWLLQTDYRKAASPYLDHLSMDVKYEYDVFRVIYVSNDDIFNVRFFPHHMLVNGEESDEGEGLES